MIDNFYCLPKKGTEPAGKAKSSPDKSDELLYVVRL